LDSERNFHSLFLVLEEFCVAEMLKWLSDYYSSGQNGGVVFAISV
jgi:hypothetical protein